MCLFVVIVFSYKNDSPKVYRKLFYRQLHLSSVCELAKSYKLISFVQVCENEPTV